MSKLLTQILCCPQCKSDLEITELACVCSACKKEYLKRQGIYCLLPSEANQGQEKERVIREKAAQGHDNQTVDEIISLVSNHHCMPVMKKKANHFMSFFNKGDVLVDIGCGVGYYWQDVCCGSTLILVDFAMNNLLGARKVLKNREDVFFIQADASCLPIKSHSVAGIWSVQVTQHFPENIMQGFISELTRVLKKDFLIEIFNSNPSWFHKISYRLRGKRFHTKGKRGDVVVNRLNAKQTRCLWRKLGESAKIKISFSELFFHPDFRLRPQKQIVAFFDVVLSKVPFIPSLFARQISIKIENHE